MAMTIHVDIVSAEEQIFSGLAEFVALPGEAGELGILPGHMPLMTRIKPGAVRVKVQNQSEEELVFVAGGLLEVQPNLVDGSGGYRHPWQGSGRSQGAGSQASGGRGFAEPGFCPGVCKSSIRTGFGSGPDRGDQQAEEARSLIEDDWLQAKRAVLTDCPFCLCQEHQRVVCNRVVSSLFRRFSSRARSSRSLALALASSSRAWCLTSMARSSL